MRRRTGPALLAAVLAALASGCARDGGDQVDPRLVQFCRQQGHAPGTERFQECLVRYSLAGRGKELDWGATGLDNLD